MSTKGWVRLSFAFALLLAACSSGTVVGGGVTDGGNTVPEGDASVQPGVDGALPMMDGSVVQDSGMDSGPTNHAPTASFTASVDELEVAVDASASSDSDGTIASYAWDFGDGATATGVTPAPHTYATDGTKTITLTVTDNQGAESTATQMVVVMAGVTNQSPVASFTTSVSNLTVTVNGSASSDPDGTIASYAWTFGDGATATGATPAAHAYGTAGTKSITLTVTDNTGATGSLTKMVTVTAPVDTTSPGAHLPIDYSLGSINGTKYFVATNGNNSNVGTTEQAPLATLAAAVAKVGSGQSATIIVRGGEYAESDINLPAGRTYRIIAYPKETPTFTGAQKFSSGWVTEGNLAYHAYVEMPSAGFASGIHFETGVNLANTIGAKPDQAWIGNTQLQQVASKGEVAAGKFYVDEANDRLYLLGTDAAKSGIEASNKRQWLHISAANTTVEGIRAVRYSNTSTDYGVVRVEITGGGSVWRNVEIIDPAFQTFAFGGSAASIMQGVTMEHVTIDGPNWMGVNTSYVDHVTFEAVKFVNANRFGEFTTSPQSGAVKTSRCRYIKVLDSDISNNRSHGLWFDQSNVDVDVANTTIDNNAGSGLFFEISDDLLLINSFVRSTGGNRALKLAGSSGLKLVNNTIIGGVDPVGVNTDSRSKVGCADPAQPLCAGSPDSDRRSAATRPATLDWMPRLDLMLNNIVAYPSGTGYCSGSTTLCITSTNGAVTRPIETIIHPAEPGRGIPKTRIDGNVYANGSGAIVRVSSGSYTTVAAWTSAAAGAPISIAGIDANGKSGDVYVNANGSATGSLDHDQAVAVPTDTNINEYIPAGTKHFGWLH